MREVNSGEIHSSWETFSPHAHDPVKNILRNYLQQNPSSEREKLLVMSVNLNCMLLILHISGIMPTTKAFLQSDPSDWGIIRVQSTVCTQQTRLVVASEWLDVILGGNVLPLIYYRLHTEGSPPDFLGEPKHWVFIHNLILWGGEEQAGGKEMKLRSGLSLRRQLHLWGTILRNNQAS